MLESATVIALEEIAQHDPPPSLLCIDADQYRPTIGGLYRGSGQHARDGVYLLDPRVLQRAPGLQLTRLIRVNLQAMNCSSAMSSVQDLDSSSTRISTRHPVRGEE